MGVLANADESQDNSISNYLNTISHAMLLCDDEPSPVSSDEVFFICEKQTKADHDDTNRVADDDDNDSDENQRENNESDSRSDCEDDSKLRKTTTNRLNRTRGCKKSLEAGNTQSVDADEKNTNSKKSVKEAESQTSHTILVKIQVENCSTCPEKSISVFSHEPPGTNKENPCKKKKTVAVQVNFNSIESVVESHCVKISKVRCCNKASLMQNVTKINKKSTVDNVEKSDCNKTSDSTKIYLWSGKSAKKKSIKNAATGAPVVDKPKAPPTIQEPPPKVTNIVEKNSVKSKKLPTGCSPLKKLNRSSLTIEPDKITINLSKYSPCASRLAASSKILSSNSPLSPDSPLHGVARSPRRIEHVQSVDRAPRKKPAEKMTLQASLSLNIQQYQKSHPTPRSRSVGDSCVTSPTSEATTLSYSPTGTEILSLEEVGAQSGSNEAAGIFVLPTTEMKDKFKDDYVSLLLKGNLETKC